MSKFRMNDLVVSVWSDYDIVTQDQGKSNFIKVLVKNRLGIKHEIYTNANAWCLVKESYVST